ncbi:class I SAM-dependent methyltransferase [Desulfospira joergensenii]|uniref:class I SAM-dependent methyltransferase n=1 Tax=Desulfospira joergensenii TaxID=53329 RepID=UPI0003B4FDAD|nr:class I SAM-dependent methyltransferase [Desulfospira joergensenii]
MTAETCAHDSGDVDWARRWENFGQNSFLKKSQTEHPEKWQNFYDRVSDVWDRMAGISLASGQEMARVLFSQGVLSAQNSILELGCGPGNLSMALAGYGCRVTAVDLSHGMIRALENKIQTRGITGIQPLAADWNTLDSAPGHDLVMAAFFPEACHPQGISRMETLAEQTCVLVLGNGTQAFPLYREIWTRVMDLPCPQSWGHLTCAENFLRQTGRHPDLYTLRIPAVLDIEYHRAREYFRAYFAMFGCSGLHLDKTIDGVLAHYIKNDHIFLEGESGVSMVCWAVPSGSSNGGIK